MKKYLFLATAAIAALASCTSDDFVGDKTAVTSQNENGAIIFGTGVDATTRGDRTGADAATDLNNQFVIWGEKSSSQETGTAGTPVFINYVVNYSNNTAQTSESNSSNWEYVGQSPYSPEKVTSNATPATVAEQTIKYWDFTNKYYTFTAFSALSTDISNDKVFVNKIATGTDKYSKGYSMTVKTGADINKIYFSDRTPVEAGSTTNTNPVNLRFRNLVSRVRFGFYETIPGYSVKITNVKFNNSDHTSDGANNFGVDCSGAVIIPGDETSFTVTYDNGSVTSANENKAKVAVQTGSASQNYLSTTATSFFSQILGITSNNRTWENGGNYTTILPNTSNTTDLTLTISYTLTSTDGSGETITITDATAKVPAVYAQWQASYAYSYIFKISDNTNGSSGQSIDGLYPITFNAVVVEDEIGNQETITTVATPSITTYTKGVVVSSNDEYTISKPIYVVVDKNGSVQTLSETNAKLYLVTNNTGSASDTPQAITEASVANALERTGVDTDNDSNYDTWTVTGVNMKDLKVTTVSVPTLSFETSITEEDSPTGVAITVNNAKFTPSTAGTYAFEFMDASDGNKKYYKIIQVK